MNFVIPFAAYYHAAPPAETRNLYFLGRYCGTNVFVESVLGHDLHYKCIIKPVVERSVWKERFIYYFFVCCIRNVCECIQWLEVVHYFFFSNAIVTSHLVLVLFSKNDTKVSIIISSNFATLNPTFYIH